MRDITRRLYDYIELIVLPRLASQLGSGWEADGLVLTAPDGRDFAVSLDLLRPPPKLLVRRAPQADTPFDQTPIVEVVATATPKRIAHALQEELCSQCADGSGDSSEVAVSAAESSITSIYT